MRPDFEIAYIGLVGVVVGAATTACLTFLIEWLAERKKRQKHLEYLAILVSSMLDRYVVGCAEVVADDGLYRGQPDADGYRKAQSPPPVFEPLTAEVEWKSLPSNLMNDVLSFPLEIDAARSKIHGAHEYEASPPDFEEYFAERQYQYSLLGRKASELSSRLQKSASLPTRSSGSWNPVEYMEAEIAKHEKWRAEQESRNAANLPLAL